MAVEDHRGELLRLPSKIKRQVEYYFSERNWRKDRFLQGVADIQGYVTIDEIAVFPRMRNMMGSLGVTSSFVAEALSDSKVVEVSKCRKLIRRHRDNDTIEDEP